jgi:hypothetical protein
MIVLIMVQATVRMRSLYTSGSGTGPHACWIQPIRRGIRKTDLYFSEVVLFRVEQQSRENKIKTLMGVPSFEPDNIISSRTAKSRKELLTLTHEPQTLP